MCRWRYSRNRDHIRAILPKPEQVTNLLVPVCLSASHVAYSSVRMEPQYMMIGQAAGVTAALAIQGNIPVQQVSVQKLQTLLQKDGTISTSTSKPQGSLPHPPSTLGSPT